MLIPALALMFAAAPVEPAFLANDVPRSVRLTQAPEPVRPASALPSYDGWSRAQLRHEYDRLKEVRPGIGLPIGLMAGGGGALTTGLYILMLGLASSGGSSGAVPFLILFGIIGTGGATMVAIGGILLSRAVPDRRIYGVQLDEVDRLLSEDDGFDRRDPPVYVPPEPDIIGPPPQGPPPPPLPPYIPQTSVQFPLLFVRF